MSPVCESHAVLGRQTRPVLLDLYSGAGGAARGYQEAGFYVVGVDISPQPRYAGDEFVQMDALKYLETQDLSRFSAIHASPPCQGYSRLRHLPWLKGRTWPMLIEPTRARLDATRLPYTIENVMDAPLLNARWLCGRMFALPLYRHRQFESNWRWFPPSHMKHGVVIGHGRMVNDRRKGSLNNGSAKGAWGNQTVVTVAGGQFRKADGERAMGIDWMTKDELAESIPPAYTKFIGTHLMAHLMAVHA